MFTTGLKHLTPGQMSAEQRRQLAFVQSAYNDHELESQVHASM